MITFATITRDDISDTPLFQTLPKLHSWSNVRNRVFTQSLEGSNRLLFKQRNTDPICKAYNELFEIAVEHGSDYCVFIHDDVWIEDKWLYDKIERYLKEYDIIGLAGCSDLTIKPPCLWHIMGKQRFGTVGHYIPVKDKNGKETKHWYGTTFGLSEKQVLVVDGLFIGVNVKKVKEAGLKFDEDLPGFHHYDLKYCLDAHKIGLKTGVVPILVTHKSPGLMSLDDEAYKKSEEVFLHKVNTNQ